MREAELLARERFRKDVAEIANYPFYSPRREVSDSQRKDLQKLLSADSSYFPLPTVPTDCGPFHPDYAVSWKNEDGECHLLICYGCNEAMFVSGKNITRHVLRNILPDLKSSFAAFAAKRPTGVPPVHSAADKTATAVTANDSKAIRGKWRVTYSEDSGRVAPQEAIRDLRFVFTEKNMTTEIAGRKSEIGYSLDASTNPKSINFIEDRGPKAGIYDLQGDTLRICFSESNSVRPTSFDSQPDSANDVLIMLKRIRPGDDEKNAAENLDHSGPLTPELAKALIPKAASISNEDFKALAQSPSAETIDNQSLSLALMALDISEDVPSYERDFKFLVNGVPKPSDLAAAMALSRAKGYVSMIQPEYITECRIWDGTTPGRARGSVSFNAPLLYVGAALFEAKKVEGEWQIDKFTLQARRITVVLGPNGKWKREDHPPVKGASIQFEIPSRIGTGVAFSKDSALLAETNRVGVRIWDITNGDMVAEFDPNGESYAPAFAPDGNRVFFSVVKNAPDNTNGVESTIQCWDWNVDEDFVIGTLPGIARDLRVSSDGTRVAIASFNEDSVERNNEGGKTAHNQGYLSIHDVERRRQIVLVDFRDIESRWFSDAAEAGVGTEKLLSNPNHVRFNSAGDRIAVAFSSSRTLVLDAHFGLFERVVPTDRGITCFGPNNEIESSGFSYDQYGVTKGSRAEMYWRAREGRYVVVMDSGGSIQLKDLNTPGFHLRLLQPDTPNPALAVSPSGQYAAVGETSGTTVWKIEDRGQLNVSSTAATSAGTPAPTLPFTAVAPVQLTESLSSDIRTLRASGATVVTSGPDDEMFIALLSLGKNWTGDSSAIEALQNMTGMPVIRLVLHNNLSINNESFTALSGIQPQQLWLQGIRLGNEHLTELIENNDGIVRFVAKYVGLDNESIRILGHKSSLKQIQIRNTGLTSAAEATLQKALPDCKVRVQF